MILQIVLLLLASFSTIFFVIFLIKGKEYTSLVENLDASEYFLKEIYIVGFALSNTKLFRLRGKLERELKKSSKLVWNNIYFEYYANLVWAQFLALGFLTLCVGLIISSFFAGAPAVIVLFMMILFIMAIWNLSMSKMKEAVNKRRDECELEFPNMVPKLTLLINSGMVLREAWYLVANGKEGPLYTLMKKACEDMENGDSDAVAINKFGTPSDSNVIKKFTSAMVQGIEKGNSELADFLNAQVSELLAHKRQLALQNGEVAAGKLIIPLGITFGGIIMIIIAASMQSMSF